MEDHTDALILVEVDSDNGIPQEVPRSNPDKYPQPYPHS